MYGGGGIIVRIVIFFFFKFVVYGVILLGGWIMFLGEVEDVGSFFFLY